jgi:hypothetical protein
MYFQLLCAHTQAWSNDLAVSMEWVNYDGPVQCAAQNLTQTGRARAHRTDADTEAHTHTHALTYRDTHRLTHPRTYTNTHAPTHTHTRARSMWSVYHIL